MQLLIIWWRRFSILNIPFIPSRGEIDEREFTSYRFPEAYNYSMEARPRRINDQIQNNQKPTTKADKVKLASAKKKRSATTNEDTEPSKLGHDLNDLKKDFKEIKNLLQEKETSDPSLVVTPEGKTIIKLCIQFKRDNTSLREENKEMKRQAMDIVGMVGKCVEPKNKSTLTPREPDKSYQNVVKQMRDVYAEWTKFTSDMQQLKQDVTAMKNVYGLSSNEKQTAQTNLKTDDGKALQIIIQKYLEEKNKVKDEHNSLKVECNGLVTGIKKMIDISEGQTQNQDKSAAKSSRKKDTSQSKVEPIDSSSYDCVTQIKSLHAEVTKLTTYLSETRKLHNDIEAVISLYIDIQSNSNLNSDAALQTIIQKTLKENKDLKHAIVEQVNLMHKTITDKGDVRKQEKVNKKASSTNEKDSSCSLHSDSPTSETISQLKKSVENLLNKHTQFQVFDNGMYDINFDWNISSVNIGKDFCPDCPENKRAKATADKRNQNLSEEIHTLKQQIAERTNVSRSFSSEQQLQKEVKDLTERLSIEMNNKLSRDESALENIGIKNRPMNIASDYEHFCANTWFDAVQALEKKGKNEDNMKYLAAILMMAEKETAHVAEQVWANFRMLMLQPIDAIKIKLKGSLPGTELPADVLNLFGDYMRHKADTVNLEALTKDIAEKIVVMKDFKNYMKIMDMDAIRKYLKECGRLGWKMAIQRPVMKFKAPVVGKKYDPKQQELHWGSDPESSKSTIRYMIYPVLMHSDKTMVKGKVFVK